MDGMSPVLFMPCDLSGAVSSMKGRPCSSLQVNHKLEQCAEDCIAKLLKSLAVRNQDRSSRPWAAAEAYGSGREVHGILTWLGNARHEAMGGRMRMESDGGVFRFPDLFGSEMDMSLQLVCGGCVVFFTRVGLVGFERPMA